ncbi:hypothetical protein [Bathymodiolus japonicus methanotrophic gill symbiont]|uniref:hypothetical protein n=1 Tax=Bathymodiolus japonicus methanotrophic gill symbiont TaxID=113269 RepID=UPI001C8DDF1B|nr:hypothetical protein [Bathymodiolus japonicus methanotrophic gill symbiont]
MRARFYLKCWSSFWGSLYSKTRSFCESIIFQARISRISSYTIRAVQNAIITGMSLQCFMSSLVARLVSRPQLIGEH